MRGRISGIKRQQYSGNYFIIQEPVPAPKSAGFPGSGAFRAIFRSLRVLGAWF